jgi:hypothetical protein
MAYLEIAYSPAYWVHHLRAEIDRTPALKQADMNWATSPLLDLAFGLETRIGNLIEISRQVDENLRTVGRELESEADLDALVAGGYAYRMRDEVALRRVIIGLNCLVVESRSCFENLAKFYREFIRNYFGESISVGDGYAKVAAAVDVPGWADNLGLSRHDIVHERSPWIRFEIQSQPRRYQAILILEYRLNIPPRPEDEIGVAELQALQGQLTAALAAIRRELIERVKALR